MNQEEIRKQFEVWADENQYALDRSDINKEIYRNNLTRNALLGYLAGYQAALASKQEGIKQGLDDIQLSMSMFANKEDYLKAVKEQEHIESNQEAHSDLKVAISALKELACLGNGDIYGNSIGNYIAIDALNLIKFNQPKAIEPSQVSMPNEIVFGSGKIGVHTEIMSERKAIWLSTLGSGIVDAPTNHPDATSLAPEHVLSVMVFNSKESCKVLIDALTDLYSTEPAQDNEGRIAKESQ